MLRTILEPRRPRIALVYLFALSPAVAVPRRRAGARRRGRAQWHHGPRPSDHDRLCGRNLPGRHGLRGRPLRGPSAELLRHERRGHQRDGRRVDRSRRLPPAVRLRGHARAQRVAGPGRPRLVQRPGHRRLDDGARRNLSDRTVPDAGRPGHHQHRRAHQPQLRRRPDRLRAAQEPRPADAVARVLLRVRAECPVHGHGLPDAGLLEDGAQLPVEGEPEFVLPRVRGLGRRRPEQLAGERRRLQRQGLQDQRRHLRRRRRAVRHGDAGRLRARRDPVPGRRRHQLQARGHQGRREVRQPRQRLQRHGRRRRRPVHAGRTSSAARASAFRSATTASSRAGPGSSATRTGSARIRAAPPSTARPGRCARPAPASVAVRASPVRSGRFASWASASSRARACRARAACATRARASRRAAVARAAPARCARWAARSTASASTPVATR